MTAMDFVFLVTRLTPLIPSTGPGIWDNNARRAESMKSLMDHFTAVRKRRGNCQELVVQVHPKQFYVINLISSFDSVICQVNK